MQRSKKKVNGSGEANEFSPINECSFKFSLLKKAKPVRGGYEPQEDTDLKLIIFLRHSGPMAQFSLFQKAKGSDWIRLVFTHPFPLNSGAPIASGNPLLWLHMGLLHHTHS